jgi:hypothetical protein
MTMYDHHKRDIARGWEPYPFAHLLPGAPINWKRVRINLLGFAVIVVFVAAIAEVVAW